MTFRVWPRWLARLLAFLGGYFWIPCPICGRPFAGFEWAPGEALMDDWCHGWGICPDCIPESRRRNTEYIARNQPTPWWFVEPKIPEKPVKSGARPSAGEPG